MLRVAFLVDGFNVYHSLRDASRSLGSGGLGTRWLDLAGLVRGTLQQFDRRARVESIDYFSAYARHLEARRPGVVVRHRSYVQAIEATGVRTTLGRFRRTTHFCPECRQATERWEEKESDVAIGVRMLELSACGFADAIVLVSGDSDLIPAVLAVKRVRPRIEVVVGFPYNRAHSDLAKAADHSFKFSAETYARHQLPRIVQLSGGRVAVKPDAW